MIWGSDLLTGLPFVVDCPLEDHDERADCIVKAKVMGLLSVHEREVREKIVEPMRGLDPEVAKELGSRLEDTIASFERILAERPDFWQEVTLK